MLYSSCAAHYIVFTWIFGVCYGFVLLSSLAGAGNAADILEPGGSFSYDMFTTVLLNEKDEMGKDVGFLVNGEVLIHVLWGSSDQQRLLKFEVSPNLLIKSRKAPTPEGFVSHSSNLDNLQNKQFFVHWNRGHIEKIFLPKNERLSIANLKKGIASLFQFQLLDGENIETDSSGKCNVTYMSTSPNIMRKIKHDCISSDLPFSYNPNFLLGTNVKSERIVVYELSSTNDKLKQISSDEYHIVFLNAKENIGNKLEVHQSLLYKGQSVVSVVDGNTIEEVWEKVLDQEGISFTHESLLIEKENEVSDIKKFSEVVQDCRENLKSNLLGKIGSAKSFIRLVSSARLTEQDDILKVLKSKKNKDILHQLYDVLGFTQTKESHEAAMKNLHIENQDLEEYVERYFWALSLSPHPNPEIIEDLVKRYLRATDIPLKVMETLLQTAASMSHRLSKFSHKGEAKIMVRKVEELLIHGFENSKEDQRLVFLRSLKNLKSKSSLPFLLKTITNGTLKEGTLAWKVIASLDSRFWDEEVRKKAWTTFFQLDKIHDSSSRALACDVLLTLPISDEQLKQLIMFLLSEDKNYEMKQYLWQKIKMISERNKDFENRVKQIIKMDVKLNNYHALAPKGLSTALIRKFLESSTINGTLMTVQEINSGIVKRGIVDILLEKDSHQQEISGLGIFSRGLSSFLSSDSEDDPDESATAGIELTILGTQIRPFVFFNGQGELMGHVWSGTASEMTSAFQNLILLEDHKEYIRLGPGFFAEIDVKGSISFDLSGKIEISLWNRNAASTVEKSAGVVFEGFTKVNTDFVKTHAEFVLYIEPMLNLQTDIDFSSDPKLCMNLHQPEFLLRHNIFKIERIPGSKHRLRKVSYRKSLVPGKTYALNKKNNEMCSAIHGN